MGVETIIATAAIASAVAAGASAYTSYDSAKDQRKEQKRARREAEALQAEQDAKALEERKQLIDAQRQQLVGAGSSQTRGTSTTGITGGVKGKINETLG